MAGRTVGSVSLSVVPDAATFFTLLRAQLLPQAGNLGRDIGRQMGAQISQAISDSIKAGMLAGAASAGTQGAAAGNRYGQTFADTVRARIDAALRSLPAVNINVNSTDAEREIEAIRLNLEELKGQHIGIDITTGDALFRIERLQARLAELGRSSPDIAVRVDAARASAQLEVIIAEAKKVADESPTIKVDVDDAGVKESLAADAAAAEAAGGGFSLMLFAGLALGPTLIPVIAAISGALLGLISTIGAVGAALGVIGLAFVAVSGAVKALTGEQNFQAAQAARTGAAASSSANRQVSAAAQVKAAEDSLANARANAKDAAIRAAEAVASAKEAEGKAETTAADNTRAALDRLDAARTANAQQAKTNAAAIAAAEAQQAVAERDLARAQQNALDAQNALIEARKTAQQQMEDLNNQVIDGANNERQAKLDIQTAQVNLENVNAPGSIATDQVRQQAQLTFDEAVQHLNELQQQNEDLRTKQEEAQKAGIDGSAVVIAATRGVADANQAVVDAQQKVVDSTKNVKDVQTQAAVDYAKTQKDITTAVANVTKVQLAGAQSIIDAQRRVSDAIRAQAAQQRQSAFTIEQALAAVAAANRGVASAGGGGTAAPFDKFAAQIAKLSPAVKEFAEFILNTLKPAFKGMTDAAAEGLLPGVEAGFKRILPFMPQIDGFILHLGQTIGHLFDVGAKALTSPFFTKLGTFLTGEVPKTFETFAKIVGNLALGFLGLLQAFSPVTDKIGGGILGLTQRFADFGQKASQPDSPFQRFVAYVRDEGPKVWKTFEHIGDVVGNFIVALAPVGDAVLAIIDKLAQLISSVDPKTLGIITVAIGGLFATFKAAGTASSLIKGLAGGLGALGVDAEGLAAASGPLGLLIAAFAAAGVVVYELYQHNKTVHDFIDKYILPIFHQLVDYFNTTVLPVLKDIGDHALKGIEKGFGFVKKAIEDNHQPLQDLIKFFGEVVDFVVKYVLPLIGPVLEIAFQQMGLVIATGVTAIATIVDAIELVVAAAQGKWDKVHEYFSTGIRGIVGLINEFIGAINSIPGIPNIPLIPVPAQYTAPTPHKDTGGHGKAFAGGGVIPGYEPGVDRVPIMASPGEAVLVPELVQALTPEWILKMNHHFSGGRPSGSDHFAGGGILGGIKSVASGIVDTGLGVIKTALGPAERALINKAESIARDGINYIFPEGSVFRGLANFSVKTIGDSFKFSGGGLVPRGATAPRFGGGISYADIDGRVISQGGPTYQLHVANHRRDIGGPEVVTAINQMHALHGDPMLATV